MADPSACRDWPFRPSRNGFNFGNKKKSHRARSGVYGGGGGGGGGDEAKQSYFFLFFKNAVTIAKV